MDIQKVLEKTKAFLFRRQAAYKGTFLSDNGQAHVVLKDLAHFCRANSTTFQADPRLHAVLEGRREVWLRIQKHLNLTEEQLWQEYGKRDIE